ncbi:XRE family transcriptional regulator [Ruminococcus sp.]|uniref:helix-turn-helix domain-containing protein n=1 Tax=Ruminococcus sp. TaxID=41978 RepID=UPI0025FA0301|nr:XRE family transcriptional regulator [Ruminococcus sp.]
MKHEDKKPNISLSKSDKKSNITNPVHLKDAHAVGKRIKYYRERLGLEQKAVASEVGITPNAVSNWESGRTRPDFSVVPRLCELLGISLYELYGIDSPLNIYTEKEQSMIEDYRSMTLGHQLAIDNMISSLKVAEYTGSIPEVIKLTFCDKGLAAGFDSGAEFDDEGEPIYLYPNTNTAIRQADLVFAVNGDSMEPEYHDGDMVLVEKYPGCPELKYGEVGAFMVGNNTYIKVLEEDGLHSLNKKYAPMHFNNDDNVYLIGRVLGIIGPESIASQTDAANYESIHSED